MSKVDDLRGARAGHGRHVEITTISAADVAPEPVRWLWVGRIPLGKVTLIEGPPGLGKTLLALDIAARCSAGKAMPLQADAAVDTRFDVLIVSYEDGLADTLRPRLEAAGADLDRVHLVERTIEHRGSGPVETLLAIPEDIAELEQRIHDIGARLVVIDPLMAAISGRVDSHKDQDVRRVLAELGNLAKRTGAAVVVIRHLRKATDGSAVNAGQGSIGIIAAARAAHLVASDPDDPDSRIFAVVKSNLAHHPVALRFSVREVKTAADIPAPVINWLEEAPSLTADMLVAPEVTNTARNKSAMADAVEFLSDALAAGPRLVEELKTEAKGAGVGWRTVERAKGKIGVRAKHDGEKNKWRWHPLGRKTATGGDGHLGGLQAPERSAQTPGNTAENSKAAKAANVHSVETPATEDWTAFEEEEPWDGSEESDTNGFEGIVP